MRSTIEVIVKGPLSDGRARAAAAAYADAVEYAVAWQSLAEAMRIMDGSFRNPTPYYETQVTVQPVGQAQVLHDRGIAYGPWLEGVSRRNLISRFKGYRMFRRARAAVLPQIQRIAHHVFVAGGFQQRMNGR